MDIKEASRYIAGKGLVQASSGNISEKFENGNICIKASGVWMDLVKFSDFVMIDIDGNKIYETENNPSVEWRLHTGVYKIRQDIKVVLHCQSPAATSLCCKTYLSEIDFDIIPEILAYCKKVITVGYYKPGSEDLAKAVSESFKYGDAVMMANHGQVLVGNSFEEVIQKALFLELACGIIQSDIRLNDKED